jgi:hypothetical protein
VKAERLGAVVRQGQSDSDPAKQPSDGRQRTAIPQLQADAEEPRTRTMNPIIAIECAISQALDENA